MPNPPVVPVNNSQTSSSDPRKGNSMTVFLDTQPYPTVEGDKDPETVALLKEDYAGAAGELTGILQYIYQSARDTDNESFANAILQIAIVEMSHLDMLSDAIETLGGRPSYDNGKVYWQAGNVNYASNMTGMLEADIQAETTAIANYEKHAAQTKNASVRALLLRIVDDEKLHLRFFTETLAKINASE